MVGFLTKFLDFFVIDFFGFYRIYKKMNFESVFSTSKNEIIKNFVVFYLQRFMAFKKFATFCIDTVARLASRHHLRWVLIKNMQKLNYFYYISTLMKKVSFCTRFFKFS